MTLGSYDRADDYLLLVNLSADWRLTYRRPMRVLRGEVVIADLRIGVHCDRHGTAGLLEFRMSSLLMRQWVPDPGVVVGKILGTQSLWTSALSSHIACLARAAPDEGQLPLQFFPEHLGALLALVAHELGKPETKIEVCPADKFAEVMKVLEAHCADHDFNACLLAQACAVSPRTLHRILARRGTSYGELVLRCRIDRAHALLRARQLRHLTIAEIGYRAGFRHPSNFARAFRERFGMRPADARC